MNLKLLEQRSMFMLEIYAIVAEEENRIKSENIKWGIRQGFVTGKSGDNKFKCYGYRKKETGWRC